MLDFFIEALEEWQKAKDAFRLQMANHASSMTNVVPLHEVRLDAMTGASAGGMCAAIASVMLQGDCQHIVTGDEGTAGSPTTTNTFYEGWVKPNRHQQAAKRRRRGPAADFTTRFDDH